MPRSGGTRRKILLFALVFLPCFVLCLWLYPRVQPVYQKAVVSAIDVGLHRLDPPMGIEISDDGGWTTHTIQPDGTERFYWSRPGHNLTLFFLGLALLPALLAATPVDLRRRAFLLAVGLFLLYVLHVLAGFGLVLSVRCLANDPNVLICKWGKTIGNTFGQVTAFVIWGALTWQVWFPRADAATGRVESRTIGRGILVRNPGFSIACVVSAVLLVVAYGNHFANGLHYADASTILDNLSIRSLGNTGKFFTDSHTFSTQPETALYRPVLSLGHAVDYWAGAGLSARQFHRTQFVLLLALGCLLVFPFKRFGDLGRAGPENRYIALTAALLLGVHVASTGTVNDISARADLVAALCIAASFGIYLGRPGRRRYHLYLLPMLVGALAAPSTLAFAPLLVAFVWMFDEDRPQHGLLRRSDWTGFGAVLRRCAPALILAGVLLVLLRWMAAAAVRAAPGGGWRQLIHEPYTWLHQARLFLLPFGLSADPAWGRPGGWLVLRALVGLAFLVLLVVAVDRLARVPSLRPAAFGLTWFGVTALATVSLRAPAEGDVTRPLFLSYVGLAFAVVWLLAQGLRTLQERGVPAVRWAAAGLAIVLVVANVAATRQRNRVWLNDATLWADAVRKNPDSPRSRLNYGRALTGLGRDDEALEQLEQAGVGMSGSPMLELQLARIAAATARVADAEKHFEQALRLAPRATRNRHAFARWLTAYGRGPEAVEQLTIAAGNGPTDANVRRLLMSLHAAAGNEAELQSVAQGTLQILATDYVARSYAAGRIPMWAAEESAEAYAELAEQRLDTRRWVDAALYLRQVVALEPRRPRSWHKLGWARTQLGFHPGAEAAYRQALEITPTAAPLWNDLAWALTQQQRYDEAIEAYEEAIRLNPRYSPARENLAWTRRQAAQHAAQEPAE